MAAFLEDDPRFLEREPQENGMVCFTELPVWRARVHRQRFGPFGIAVTWEWADRNCARRVRYVAKNGPEFSVRAQRFQLALQDLERRAGARPDGWWDAALYNRHMAAILGAREWSALLIEYEYMQTDRDSAQAEWRIVQPLPFSYNSRERSEIIREALGITGTWNITSARVKPSDIRFLTAPHGRASELREVIPETVRDLPIREVS